MFSVPPIDAGGIEDLSLLCDVCTRTTVTADNLNLSMQSSCDRTTLKTFGCCDGTAPVRENEAYIIRSTDRHNENECHI